MSTSKIAIDEKKIEQKCLRNRRHLNNLTDQLIRLEDFWRLYVYHDANRLSFLDQAHRILSWGPVREMSPSKLGELMHEFDGTEIPLVRSEIDKIVHFTGSPADFHRDLVSLLLAAYIYARMDPETCASHGLDLWVEKLPRHG